MTTEGKAGPIGSDAQEEEPVLVGSSGSDGYVTEDDDLEVEYPDDDSAPAAAGLTEEMEQEIDQLVEAAVSQLEARPPTDEDPRGYVTNARNAGSTSDSFSFWASADTPIFGIGSIVRQSAESPGRARVETYGVVDASEAQTLGLDDLAIHVYETDARPPITGLAPATSRRRPIVVWRARVLSSSGTRPRPVLDGPVFPVRGDDELLAAHGSRPDGGGPKDQAWSEERGMLLGFYQDDLDNFSAYAEERVRVLGPQQGHVVLSGVPGAGKTSMFLMLLTAEFAKLRRLEQRGTDATEGGVE